MGFSIPRRHSIRSLTPTLEHCEHNPSGATYTTSMPGHPRTSRSTQIPPHPQNGPTRRSRSIRIPHRPTKRTPPETPLNSNLPPSDKTSPPRDPAQFKFPTDPQNEPPRRSRSTQIPHRQTKRASPEIPLNSNSPTRKRAPLVNMSMGFSIPKGGIPLDR